MSQGTLPATSLVVQIPGSEAGVIHHWIPGLSGYAFGTDASIMVVQAARRKTRPVHMAKEKDAVV